MARSIDVVNIVYIGTRFFVVSSLRDVSRVLLGCNPHVKPVFTEWLKTDAQPLTRTHHSYTRAHADTHTGTHRQAKATTSEHIWKLNKLHRNCNVEPLLHMKRLHPNRFHLNLHMCIHLNLESTCSSSSRSVSNMPIH